MRAAYTAAYTAAYAAAAVAALTSAGGCASFGTLRSADVHAGTSLTGQLAASTPVGDAAGWFYAFDCASACDTPTVGTDVGLTYGWRGRVPASLGVGVNALWPYVDGYAQLRTGRRPFGVGARVGLPVWTWREHQLYARHDVPLGGSRRLLLNPGLFVHEGRSPNGNNPGHVVGLSQGVGLLLAGRRADLAPGVTVAAAWARRDVAGGARAGARAFAAASVGVTLHRRR